MNSWDRVRRTAAACAAAGLAGLLIMAAPGARAAAGSTADAKDDTTHPFDVVKLDHDDRGKNDDINSTVTYTVHIQKSFQCADTFEATWHLFHLSNATLGQVHIKRSTGGGMSGQVLDNNSNVAGPADVTTPDAVTIKVVFTKRALSDAGLGGEPGYKYNFEISAPGGPTDFVPDRNTDGSQPKVQHDLTDAAPTTTTTAAGATTTTPPKADPAPTCPNDQTAASNDNAAAATTTTTSGSKVLAQTSSSPCGDANLSASPAQVSAGGSTTLTGRCFPANTDLTITMASDPVTLANVRSDGNGSFSATVVIPRSTRNGTHTISASGGGRAASTVISVGLAFTGGGHTAWVGLAVAMVFAGLVLVAGRLLADQHDRWVETL